MGANPNTITAGIQETWDKVYQVTHHKVPVYPAIANFRLAPGLKVGDTVNRQYRSTIVANDMGADGSYSTQALTDTNEQLVINKEKEASFYIKSLDELQNHLPTRAKYAYDSAAAIFNQIDGDVLGTYDQFTRTLDDGVLGGTSGNGITVTVSNVRQLFSASNRLLQRDNIMLDQVARFTGFRKEDNMRTRGVAVLSPDVYQLLMESLDSKDTALGDSVGINGHVGRYFGYDIFVSNATGWSGKLLFGTNPTDGDTVVINGVTFTFKATPASAGDIDIKGSAALTLDELVASINAPSTTRSGDFIAISDADDLIALKNVVATDGTTALTIKATGKGFVPVSETLTAAADVWTPELQKQHLLIGVANAIDLVIQKTPNMLAKPKDGKVGNDVVTWSAYGLKVFNESKVRMVNVEVDTSAFA